MNIQLINIINKQQEYEYLKTQLRENNNAYKHPIYHTIYGNLHSPYLNSIKGNISALVTKRKRIRAKYFISGIIFLLMIGISGIIAANSYAAVHFSPKIIYPYEYIYLPAYQIQIALNNDALLTAELMLNEQFEKNPNNYDMYPMYIKLCEKKGNYDEAVEYMIKYLTEYLELENITPENTYYQKLTDYEYPISEETQEKIDEFMKEYEYYILKNSASEE